MARVHGAFDLLLRRPFHNWKHDCPKALMLMRERIEAVSSQFICWEFICLVILPN